VISNVGFGRWSGASSFADCVRYGLRQAGGRAPVAQWFTGVSSMETAAFEMEAVASQSVVVDPVYHLIVSWGPYERPSLERVRDAVERIGDAVNLGGLQSVCMVHDDGVGGMLHVHQFVNRVDPVALQGRSMWRDEVKLREACRAIEVDDGWRVVGSEDINDSGGAVSGTDSKAGEVHEALMGRARGQPAADARAGSASSGGESRESKGRREGASWEAHANGANANSRDLYGMRKRFRSFVVEEMRPRIVELLADARGTWDRLHEVLADRQMRYEVVSAVGARIVGAVSGFGVALSEIGLRHRDFVERFGEWLGPMAAHRSARDAELRDRVDQARSVVEGISDGAGWSGVHASLGALNLGIEKRLNGIRIVDLDGPGWIRINRDDPVLSLKALTERFGEYEGGVGEVHRDAVRRMVRGAQEAIVERQLVRDPTPVLTTLMQTKSAVPFSEVKQDVFRRVTSDDARENVMRAVLSHMAAVTVGRDTLLTTAMVAEEERQAAVAARSLCAGRLPRSARAITPPNSLSAAQARGYAAAVDPVGLLKVITGVLPSERIALVEGIASAYRSAGYRVRAVSSTRAGVADIAALTTVPTQAIGREVRALANASSPKALLDARDVVIVDQASLVGSEYGSALLRAAARADAVVVAISTYGEGQSVGRGDALRVMRRAAGDRAVDVSPRVEFRSAWQAEAAQAIRRGRPRAAWQLYRDNGGLVEHVSEAQAVAAVVAQWSALEAKGVQVTIAVDSDSDRRSVGAAARAEYRALGRLTSPDVLVQTMDGAVPFAIGERVVMRERVSSDRGFAEGDRGVVREIVGPRLTIARADGVPVAVDTTVHPGVQYAYASSEPMKEAGGSNQAELAILSKGFDQRRVAAGMCRGGYEFGAHYSREQHKRGFKSVVEQAERTERNVLVIDGIERGRGDVVFGARLDHELAKGRQHGPELGVELR
jgi:hypothetical protein